MIFAHMVRWDYRRFEEVHAIYCHIHELAIDEHLGHSCDTHLVVGAGKGLFVDIDLRLAVRNLN